MSRMSTDLSRHEKRARTQDSTPPLVVRPREAARLLACSPSSLYGLLRAGELESYRETRARKITMRSIEKYIARQIAAGPADGWGPWPYNPRALAKRTPADRKQVPHRRRQISKPATPPKRRTARTNQLELEWKNWPRWQAWPGGNVTWR